AGRQGPLDMRAPLFESRKALSAEQPFELLVGQAGIGNSRFALQRLELLLRGALTGSFDPVFEQFVDEHIHAADKKASHRSNAADVFASRKTLFQCAQISLGDLAVVLDREDERDVDVDALGKRLANGGNACRGRGNLY